MQTSHLYYQRLQLLSFGVLHDYPSLCQQIHSDGIRVAQYKTETKIKIPNHVIILGGM